MEHRQPGSGGRPCTARSPSSSGLATSPGMACQAPVPEAEERAAGRMRQTQHLGGHAPAELQWIADKDVERPCPGDGQQVGHHPRRQEPGEDITHRRERRGLRSQGAADVGEDRS